MQIEDLSPPSIPSLDEQRDALQKGLGRVVQWAKAGQLASDPLLTACLFDQRFDIQCEDNRGDWIWSLIQITGNQNRFRDPIKEALRSVTVERDSYQLCVLAFHYAHAGDTEFRKILYELVERRPFIESPDIGMWQLVELDGESAFDFITRLRGRQFLTENWDWYDECFIEDSIEVIGEQRVDQLLRESTDTDIRRFAAMRIKNVKPTAASEDVPQSHIQRMQSISVEEALQATQSKERSYWLRSWGMHASEQDLEQILKHLWQEQNPTTIAKLLQVFSKRSMPRFDPRLFELCRHLNPDVQHWAFQALEPNADPIVRQFALSELANPTLQRLVVSLFRNNFVPGDETRLFNELELPEDKHQRHSMLMDMIKVLEENEVANARDLGLLCYFYTPCQECRYYAARLLHDRNVAPEWLIDECRYDANENCQSIGTATEDDSESSE